MIRLPPTRVELTDSDIQFHLQGIMLRHGLIADFENLDIGSDDDNEDDSDNEYTQLPGTFRKSGTSSSAPASLSDIIPDSESREGSYSDRRYQVASYGRRVMPETASAGISQLDGASCLDHTALHVKNVLQTFPAGPYDTYGRQFTVDNMAPTALFSHCLHVQHTPELSEHNNSNRTEQQDHPAKTLKHIISPSSNIGRCSTSVLDLFPCSYLSSSGVGSNHHCSTDMSCDGQLPPGRTVARRSGRQRGSSRKITPRNKRIVSSGEPGLGSESPTNSHQTDASAMNIATPTKIGDIEQEIGNTASATGTICAPVDEDLSLRQEPALETPSLISNTEEGMRDHSCSISGYSVLDSKDTASSTMHPQIESTNDGDHMALSPILPGSLFPSTYFPTAYDRTRLTGNVELGDKNWLSSSAGTTGSCAPSMGPSSEIETGLTESFVAQSFETDRSRPRNTRSYRSSDHRPPSLASVVPSKKDDVLSIRHILNPDDGMESANPPQTYDTSSHSNHALRNPLSGDNEWNDQKAAAETLTQLSKSQTAPQPQDVTSYHGQDVSFQSHEELLAFSRLLDDFSSGALPGKDHSRITGPAFLANPSPNSQAAMPSRAQEERESTHPGKGETKLPLRIRQNIDEATYQRVLAESHAFQRHVDKLMAELEQEDDDRLEDFGWEALWNSPTGRWV